MTKMELVAVLDGSNIFTPAEIWNIIKRASTTYTVGAAIVACMDIGLKLGGTDIDCIIQSAIDHQLGVTPSETLKRK